MTASSRLTGVAGVILAGGASSRFGSNKALAPFEGEPLIARIASLMADLFAERLLVTNTPETYHFLGWPMTADLYPGAGPLAGIHAALSAIGAERALVVACDMPHLHGPLLRFLCSHSPEWDVVLPRLAGGPEPLHAVYSKRCLPVIERHLAGGQRKIWQFLAECKVREVGETELLGAAPDLSPFHNVNRPEDLTASPLPPPKTLTLIAAQRLLRRQMTPTAGEELPLGEALGRIPVAALRARQAVPPFCQSTRDGFAVRSRDLRHATPASPVTLAVQGEIAAGDPTSHQLRPGQTLRIMTGAPLPAGADAVIPFEAAHEEGVHLRLTAPVRPRANLRPPGTDCRRNQIIAAAGRPLTPYDLARLAPAGLETLQVHAAPRVGYLCTGSELSDDANRLAPGQIVSGNRPLLRALIAQYGGEAVDLGTVPDTVAALSAALGAARKQRLALCLTTGGMGPGKYDLVQQVLHRLGARLLYRSLKVRPGKATLAALLGDLLIVALPGPPPAVHLLFHELVAPLIRQAGGGRQPLPRPVFATLASPFQARQGGVLHLREAVLFSRNAALFARPPRLHEAPNAILLLPASRTLLKAAETATLHPLLP